MSNEGCLFCQIISGKVPVNKVYETDNVLAFLDIHPVNPGHTLIVPKKHSTNLLDADDDLLKEMMAVTKKVSKAILTALELDAFNLELNNGRLAGQIIPHLHWHIVPRSSDDGLQHWPGKSYAEGGAEILLEKIKSVLK